MHYPTPPTGTEPTSSDSNPLLTEWHTPFQTPPFSRIQNRHYTPALRVAMAETEARIRSIATQAEVPTFDNTIVAMEHASERIDRITNLLFNINECNTDDELQHIVAEMAPVLSQLSNRIYMDEQLFARVEQLYASRDQMALDEEQLTLLEETYQHFVRHGIALRGNKRKRYQAITERLAVLQQDFSRHVLADSNEYTLLLTQPAQVEGLPEHALNAAHQEAHQRGLDGWLFTLAYPSYVPFITYCRDRSLREQMWRAYNSRGSRGNDNDNNATIREMTTLRHELAQLLGYDTYCDYVLCRRMAGSRQRVEQFMQQLRDAALPIAQKDYDEVARYAAAHGGPTPLQRWDYTYYCELLKRDRYQFDFELLRPYFSLDRVRQGIFDLYERLYGLRFDEACDVETYHPDAKAYRVSDGDKLIGILYLDMHHRPSKRNGAWMTEFRDQSRLDGVEVRPLIQIVCNFGRPADGRPVLLSLDEVKTFMHEFGHAIHGLLSEVAYPSLSGTHVKRDFVEVPSQMMENWCRQREFLDTFARHFETGAPLPDEYVDHIQKSERFQAGYRCIRQLNFGSIDLAFHSLTEPLQGSIEDFEHAHMDELLPRVPGCLTSSAFTHIFAGGYAAGYYGYKWAEVLDADIFERFREEGLFNRNLATEWRTKVLSRGGTRQPAELFRDFMGREPLMQAFLKRSFNI